MNIVRPSVLSGAETSMMLGAKGRAQSTVSVHGLALRRRRNADVVARGGRLEVTRELLGRYGVVPLAVPVVGVDG